VTVPHRRLDDPRTIRALAHPVRLALLALLLRRGPLTATEAGEALAESPASASFHLRQLARFGYVEEAGGGTGRRRPWRAVQEVQEIPSSELTGDAAVAVDELDRVLAAHQDRAYDGWLRTRSSYPAQWQAATHEANAVLRLSLEQATELRGRLRAVLADYLPGAAPEQPGAVAFSYQARVFPLDQPLDQP